MDLLKLLTKLLVVSASLGLQAAPTWRLVGSYDAKNGAEATVWVDASSIIRAGKFVRAWVMTDFTEFQEGDWIEASGNSRAYMSSRQLVLVDCTTKDVGYGSWHALDGRKASGALVHSENVPVPKSANSAVAPGTVGETLSIFICKQGR